MQVMNRKFERQFKNLRDCFLHQRLKKVLAHNSNRLIEIMDLEEITIMALASQEKMVVTIRKKPRRSLEPRVQLKAIANQATKVLKMLVMKYHRHQASRVVHKIMMTVKRNQKQPNNQRNPKIEY